MPGRYVLAAFALMAATANGKDVDNANAIVAKSVQATQQDWNEAPRYSYIDREISAKRGHAKPAKTERVLMIEGSPYNELIAMNGAPLSKDQQNAEAQKLARETAKRRHESQRDRKRRIEEYEHERMQDHQMLVEMANAFRYTLTGEEMLNGHKVWVIKAAAKPDYVPQNREGKILKQMEGELWIDQSTYQWVKVQARVMKPVSMYGFLAKVKPGTRFELEQEPVSPTVWMPKQFVVRVRAEALGIRNEDSFDEDDYRDYRVQAENRAPEGGAGGLARR